MDIFAHGLWSVAIYKAANKKLDRRGKKTLNVWWATFWGIFPDLFAFTIPFVWLSVKLITGQLHISDIPRPATVEPAARNHIWAFNVASRLYNVSHSLIIFLAAFLVVWLIFRRPIWELLAWLIHILIDIPTHLYHFYPTPIFWPISQWKFTHGFSWSEPWFMTINYLALITVYLLLRPSESKQEKT